MKPLSWPRLIWNILVASMILFFLTAIVYKDDPVVRLSVRTIYVGVASFLSDAKELKQQLKKDIKEDLGK